MQSLLKYHATYNANAQIKHSRYYTDGIWSLHRSTKFVYTLYVIKNTFCMRLSFAFRCIFTKKTLRSEIVLNIISYKLSLDLCEAAKYSLDNWVDAQLLWYCICDEISPSVSWKIYKTMAFEYFEPSVYVYYYKFVRYI